MKRPITPVVLLAIVLAVGGCEGPAGPPGPPGAGPETLSDPAISPKVIYSYPPLGSEGPYDELYVRECSGSSGCGSYPVFRLRFNKYMDAGSLRAATRLTSDDGMVTLAGEGIQPLGGDVWVVHPGTSSGSRLGQFLPIGQRLTLSVDTNARDVNGNRLKAPFVFAFTPEPDFRVVDIKPSDGESNGQTELTLHIWFNAGIDSTILTAIEFDPPPIDTPRWYLNPGQAHVATYLRLAGATRYTVTLDTTASDLEGHRLPVTFSASFSTMPFSVVSIYPPNGRTGVHPGTSVSITCSDEIDAASVKGAVRFSPPADYTVSIYSRTVSLDITGDLRAETEYTITIDSTLRSITGSRLKSGVSSTFTTAPPQPLTVGYTVPGNGDTAVSSTAGIHVVFYQEIDTATIPSSFRISPTRPGRFDYGYQRQSFRFVPDLPLTAGQSFDVTIDTSLRSASGGRLTEPYNFSFKVWALRVYGMQPYDGRPDVPPAYPLQVWFSGWIDTLTVPGAVRLDPPIAGSYRLFWNGFQFTPADVWSGGVRYTLTIDTTLTALGGGTMAQPFTASFTAAPFSVLQHIPPDNANLIPVASPVLIYCNDIIDSSSAKGAFVMTDSAGVPVAGWLGFSTFDADQFGFRPFTPLRRGEWYDVTIGTGFRSARGHALGAPLHFRFRTEE